MDESVHCPVSPECPRENETNFDLGFAPCYAGILSRLLSCLGSVAIVIVYLKWKDLRRRGAQSIVTFLAIADLVVAASYLCGMVTVMAFYGRTSHSQCEAYSVLCEIESYIIAWSTMSSYLWTTILAFYFYLSIVQEKPALALKLMPCYHLTAWGLPIFIVFPLLASGHLSYAPYVTGLLCRISVPHTFFASPYVGLSRPMQILVKLPEMVGYILILVFYALTVRQIYHQVNTSLWCQSRFNRTNMILASIPVVFVFLRVWCTVQYFHSTGVAEAARQNGGCISKALKREHMALAVLQAIGNGGQGWANAILYIFLSQEIRKRMFVRPYHQWRVSYHHLAQRVEIAVLKA